MRRRVDGVRSSKQFAHPVVLTDEYSASVVDEYSAVRSPSPPGLRVSQGRERHRDDVAGNQRRHRPRQILDGVEVLKRHVWKTVSRSAAQVPPSSLATKSQFFAERDRPLLPFRGKANERTAPK